MKHKVTQAQDWLNICQTLHQLSNKSTYRSGTYGKMLQNVQFMYTQCVFRLFRLIVVVCLLMVNMMSLMFDGYFKHMYEPNRNCEMWNKAEPTTKLNKEMKNSPPNGSNWWYDWFGKRNHGKWFCYPPPKLYEIAWIWEIVLETNEKKTGEFRKKWRHTKHKNWTTEMLTKMLTDDMIGKNELKFVWCGWVVYWLGLPLSSIKLWLKSIVRSAGLLFVITDTASLWTKSDLCEDEKRETRWVKI